MKLKSNLVTSSLQIKLGTLCLLMLLTPELIENGIKSKNIIKLAIVFAGKEPFVKPLQIDENIEP